VDWDAGSDNRVLLPVLGERYADALEQGLIRIERGIERNTARFVVRYRDRALPCAPQSLAPWSDRELAELNGDIERLDAWLQRQNWRLAYWKAADSELGYRRFFDVQTLAGLRVEDEAVFEATHARFIAWVRGGVVDGLRVDHPDGLRDPERYLQRLRAAAPDSYLVVEKILDEGEALRASWPVDGTTGYDFMRLLDQAQVHPGGERALTALAKSVQPEAPAFGVLAREAKLEVLGRVLGSERERVVELAYRALTAQRPLRDATRAELRRALSQVIASYRGYRTYVQADAPITPEDRATIASAVAEARQAYPEADARLWQGIEAALTLSPPYQGATAFALAMQQLTSAIAAKAVEDTACYRYPRLLALNEVGGSPGTFGIAREAFHRALAARSGSASMLATATHDTKRGEDVRARLLVLSELAEPWADAATRWLEQSVRHGDSALDQATRYVFLQTLVGAYPLALERAQAYMLKAVREAKLHTSWTAPDLAYERALDRYVSGVIGDRELMTDIEAFVARIARPGFVASLARTLIKLTAPGVPDIYQGNELWDLSLVDPDNRRPVDFELRQRWLARVDETSPEAAMAELALGVPKLWLTARTLRLRARAPERFAGDYAPLETMGEGESAVLAYARGGELVAVVPRWPVHAAQLGEDVKVRLPDGRFQDALSGTRYEERASVTTLWSRFPVALLVRKR
jgi:(1->4)-alpha-D-glucan 1-alpha-D-glucosylmutase